MTRLGKFWHFSRGQRGALLEAAGLLALTRLAIAVVPFRYIAPYMGTCMAETPRQVSMEQADIVGLVGWAVETAARHVPWKAVCLPQALAAKWMLRRRGVQSTLYLGAVQGRPQSARLYTHAWLRAGSTVVTGGWVSCREIASFA